MQVYKRHYSEVEFRYDPAVIALFKLRLTQQRNLRIPSYAACRK